MVARALAMVHTPIFDAWAAYDADAVGTRLGGSLRRPEEERTTANKREALSYAAYRTLVDLYPGTTQVAQFDALMGSLGYDPANTSTDTSTPSGIGNTVAATGTPPGTSRSTTPPKSTTRTGGSRCVRPAPPHSARLPRPGQGRDVLRDDERRPRRECGVRP